MTTCLHHSRSTYTGTSRRCRVPLHIRDTIGWTQRHCSNDLFHFSSRTQRLLSHHSLLAPVEEHSTIAGVTQGLCYDGVGFWDYLFDSKFIFGEKLTYVTDAFDFVNKIWFNKTYLLLKPNAKVETCHTLCVQTHLMDFSSLNKSNFQRAMVLPSEK